MTTRPRAQSGGEGGIVEGERHVLELMATGADLHDVLDALCRVIDAQSGLISSIFLLNSTGDRLMLAAGPGIPEVWRARVASFPITETACGAAVSRRERTISPDIAADPLYAGYEEAAAAAGLRAVWSTPFFTRDNTPLGTFAVYSGVVGYPDAAHLRLVDRATHLASIAVERHQTSEGLRESEHLLRTVLDSLPVGVAVVNASADVILSNPASRRIWGELISSGSARYASSKGWWHDTGKRLAPSEWASVRALARGESSVNEVIDIEAFDGARKTIHNSAVPIQNARGRITGAVVVNEDVSARKTAERELQDSLTRMRALTARLMRAQDDERRRIAQMLHETTAQDLAVLKMHLARLTRMDAGLAGDNRDALSESIELADRSMSSIRTLSYLLHPPFLDEAGLVSALRWYASGFAARSGIAVDLELPPAFPRLPQDLETTLFRVVQEALINIHRHAHSSSASIRLRSEDPQLTLEIQDRGRGMPPDVMTQVAGGAGALGVGIAGMRERLQQLGGSLEMESSDHGTTVRARIPHAPGPP